MKMLKWYDNESFNDNAISMCISCVRCVDDGDDNEWVCF